MPSFSTENVLFFPFSNLFFGSELLSTPTLTGGRSEGLGSGRWTYASSPEGGSIRNSSVWIICCLFALICLFMSSFISGWTDVYFMVWVIFQCCAIYFVAQIVLVVGNSFRLILVSLSHAPILLSFEYFLIFWHCKIPQISLLVCFIFL